MRNFPQDPAYVLLAVSRLSDPEVISVLHSSIAGFDECPLWAVSDLPKSGFAFDLDEHAHGISSIGFAFIDLADEIHAISVPVQSVHLLTANVNRSKRQQDARRQRFIK